MIDRNNPFRYKQPKIYVTPTTLGPHRQRVFELIKDVPPVKHGVFLWTVTALCAGFILFGSAAHFTKSSLMVMKSFLKKEQTLVYEVATTAEQKLLGSDEAIEPTEEYAEYFAIQKNLSLPKTSGLSFLVGDVETGKIILEKNIDMVFPIASVSKLITAVVAKKELDLHRIINVTRSSIDTYGTSGGLYVGEKISVTDLYYPLLIESSNDAAEVIATGIGRDMFMKRVNETVVDMGMIQTSLNDPSGLSFKNISNARDLFQLARFINEEYPEIWDITRVKEYAIRTHKWQNANNQLRKPSFVGGKNGFTDEALKTSVSLYDVALSVQGEAKKQKRRIAIVVLKSNDRDGDLDKLLRYTEKNIGFKKGDDIPAE